MQPLLNLIFYFDQYNYVFRDVVVTLDVIKKSCISFLTVGECDKDKGKKVKLSLCFNRAPRQEGIAPLILWIRH
jgi:hypothetical protein